MKETKDMELIIRLIDKTRVYYGVTQKQLTDGLCDVSLFSKISSGQSRGLDKLLIEALMQRLGKTMRTYEFLLDEPEYRMFQIRERIRTSLEQNNLKKAEKLLRSYRTDAKYGKNKLHRQFALLLGTYILDKKGAGMSELYGQTEKAIRLTIPKFSMECAGSFFYSEIELLLAFRLAFLQMKCGNKERAVLCYRELYGLLQQERYRDHEQMHMFAPIIYHLANYYYTEGDYRSAYEVSTDGIARITDKNKIHYLSELYKISAYSATMEHFGGVVGDTAELEKMVKKSQHYQYFEILKDFTEEFYPEWNADTEYPMYREYNVLFIGDIIRQRRKLLGWTHEKVVQGEGEENISYSKRIYKNINRTNAICDIDTLSRLENGKCATHWSIEKALLQKVHLTPERYYCDFITDDYKLKLKITKTKNAITMRQYDHAKVMLEDIKQRDHYGEYRINRQCLDLMEFFIERGEKSISTEEQLEKALELLSYTMPVNKLNSLDTCYLFVNEMEILRHVAECLTKTERVQEANDLLRKVVKGYQVTSESEDEIIHRLLAVRLMQENNLGDIGHFKESNEIIDKSIRDSVKHNIFGVWSCVKI